MNWNDVWWAIGDFMTDIAFAPLESVGNMFNYSCIILGFFGLFFWLNKQRQLTAKAKNDPNQLK